MSKGHKKNIEEWKPFGLVYGKNAYDKNLNRNFFYYERRWWCQDTLTIHTSEKAVLNCHYCKQKYYKPKK